VFGGTVERLSLADGLGRESGDIGSPLPVAVLLGSVFGRLDRYR
jgi:hypothetical protein